MNLRKELEQRWFLYQYSHEAVFNLYEKGGQTLYRGCDPTADSLHLGNFVGFMHAVQWMKRGNKLILIVGGATGMIGDPWGKDSERNFLDEQTLAHNVASITLQVSKVLNHLTELTGITFDFEVRNNADFYDGVSFLWFLRDVGKYITINQMMNKETVKKRIEDPEKSISYTEFSYMLLQGYDYLRLYSEHDCKLQIAWSDQRWNIMTGLELIKRKTEGEAYGVTCPLITDSTGKKFGKSEWNALWLDPNKNSPFKIYQYFINTSDEDLERYFKLLTLADFDTITNIVEKHAENPSDRLWQELLGHAVVTTVFGPDVARQAQLITRTLFATPDPITEISERSTTDITALHEAIGNKQTAAPGDRILEVVVLAGLAESNGQAKELIKSKSITLNDVLIEDMMYTLNESDFIGWSLALLRKWKKAWGSVWKK
jgi:tyrosyl-tRNA synthetase